MNHGKEQHKINVLSKDNIKEKHSHKVNTKKESHRADADEILAAVAELDTPGSSSP